MTMPQRGQAAVPEAAPPPVPTGRVRGHRRSVFLEVPVLVAISLGVVLLLRAFVVQPFYIPSRSMEDTLQVGDRVLVDKFTGHFRDIRRGDVVVFNGVDSFDREVAETESGNLFISAVRKIGSAFGFTPPSERDYIKRVIGLPGDRVTCCDAQGRVTVNGVPLDESGYLYTGDSPSEVSFDIQVPPGRLWVMGDHRSASADSRSHLGNPGGGGVPVDKVIGRAVVVIWPFRNVGGIGVPDTFDQSFDGRHSGRAGQRP